MTTRLSEADFQRRVIDAARVFGWRVCHVRPARTEAGWRTPVEGDKGLPDLILARAGRVILAELKSDSGRTTPDQRNWLCALGNHGRLWRPSNWDAIVRELSARDTEREWLDADTTASRRVDAAS